MAVGRGKRQGKSQTLEACLEENARLMLRAGLSPLGLSTWCSFVLCRFSFCRFMAGPQSAGPWVVCTLDSCVLALTELTCLRGDQE